MCTFVSRRVSCGQAKYFSFFIVPMSCFDGKRVNCLRNVF